MVEKLITLGKRGDLPCAPPGLCPAARRRDRRQAVRPRSPSATSRAPAAIRRVLKAGFRHGDAAAMAIIELVDRDPAAKGQDSGPKPEAGAEEAKAGE